VVHVLDALPDRGRQFVGRSVPGEGEQFRGRSGWVRVGWRGQRDRWDGSLDGRWRRVVRRMREPSSPTIKKHSVSPARPLHTQHGLGRGTRHVPMTEIRTDHPERSRVFPIPSKNLGVRVDLGGRDRTDEEGDEFEVEPRSGRTRIPEINSGSVRQIAQMSKWMKRWNEVGPVPRRTGRQIRAGYKANASPSYAHLRPIPCPSCRTTRYVQVL
jgi:hypothetical protein